MARLFSVDRCRHGASGAARHRQHPVRVPKTDASNSSDALVHVLVCVCACVCARACISVTQCPLLRRPEAMQVNPASLARRLRASLEMNQRALLVHAACMKPNGAVRLLPRAGPGESVRGQHAGVKRDAPRHNAGARLLVAASYLCSGVHASWHGDSARSDFGRHNALAVLHEPGPSPAACWLRTPHPRFTRYPHGTINNGVLLVAPRWCS